LIYEKQEPPEDKPDKPDSNTSFRLSADDKKEIMRGLSLMTHIGLTMAICIIAGLFIGRFLDGLLHTSPLFLILFIAFGSAAAIYQLYRMPLGK